MIFRCYHEQRGAHVHFSIFAGPQEGALGKCGDMCMRAEEFSDFANANRSLMEFREGGSVTPKRANDRDLVRDLWEFIGECDLDRSRLEQFAALRERVRAA